MEEQIAHALRLLAPHEAAARRITCIAGLIHTLSAGVFQRRLSGSTPPADVMAAVAACIDREIAELATVPRGPQPLICGPEDPGQARVTTLPERR